MDAAGKDGTIRHVLRGVNPAGCQVTSFKQPSQGELDQDFLWRVARALPQRGRIGVFNRSHYEEVLIVRVHPHVLAGQRLRVVDPATIWDQRLRAIEAYERHLAQAGTVILKFFLHLSAEEQARRFLVRIDEPESNWKSSPGDVRERAHWDAYQHACQEALRATSRPHAPWFAVPADDKRYMRRTVADIVHDTMRRLPIDYPALPDEKRARMLRLRDGWPAERGPRDPTIRGSGACQRIQRGMAVVPENRRIFPKMTVRENLEMGAYLRDDRKGIKEDMDYVISLFPRVGERLGQQGGTMSGGEQQMLAMGRALMSRPKLILMDEPSMGLAPLFVEKIFEIIKTVNDEGISVFVVEQNANVALSVADRGYVLQTGEVVLSGVARELLNNEAMKQAYLGEV